MMRVEQVVAAWARTRSRRRTPLALRWTAAAPSWRTHVDGGSGERGRKPELFRRRKRQLCRELACRRRRRRPGGEPVM